MMADRKDKSASETATGNDDTAPVGAPGVLNAESMRGFGGVVRRVVKLQRQRDFQTTTNQKVASLGLRTRRTA